MNLFAITFPMKYNSNNEVIREIIQNEENILFYSMDVIVSAVSKIRL
jgi:hypothetical protein